MTVNKNDKVFSNHLSSDELMKYHRGLFTYEEKQIVEEHIRSCELCADALNGLSEMKDTLQIYNITLEIKKKMRKRMTSRKNIISRFDIISILLAFFIVGLVIFFAFYFFILRK